jgi:hypothetical protein
VIPELGKAYKKALAKHHPDRATQKGASWEIVVEAEEVYKLIQNKHTEWETGQLPSVPPRPASAGARGRPQSVSTQAMSRCV